MDIPLTAPTAACVIEAAQKTQLPPLVLLAIMKQEGGKPGQITKNKNGTHDHGVMQINTVWLNSFNEKGVTTKMLTNNGCVSVAAAAIILRGHLDKSGGDLWKAVGWYHSKTPMISQRYIQKISSRMNELVAFSGRLD